MSTVRPLATPAFVMLGAADAAACEGDACLVPGTGPDAVTPPRPAAAEPR